MASITFSPRWLAEGSARHPRRTIVLWAVASLLAAVAITALLPGALISGGNPIDNPQSQRARDALQRDFPATAGAATTDIIVVSSQRYSVDAPGFRTLVRHLAAEAGRASGVTGVQTYLSGGGAPLVSRDRHATMIRLAIPNRESSSNGISTVISAVERANATPGFAVSVTGAQTVSEDINTLAKKDLSSGELRFGVPAALIVLLAVFGAVVAAFLPLVLAGVAIVVALAGVALLAHAFALSTFVTNILTGMGLALGIDYALFIVSRYREERGGGRDKLAAIAASGATAGRAVLFSGTTFVIAMFGMFLVPNEVMRSIAVGAILVGVFSVIAALTLLPAVLSLLGDRVDRVRLPFFGRPSLEAANPEGRVWAAVVHAVLRRPWVGLAVPAAVLVLAASPIFGLHIGTSGITVLPQGSESRQGYEALQRDFPGATAEPATIVVADGYSRPGSEQALQRLRTTLANDPRFGPGTIRRSANGTAAVLSVPVAGDPAGAAAVAAVRQLRSTIVPADFRGTGAQVYVGGATSENIDYFDSVTGPAPYVIAFVIGLTFLLLMIVFRSVVIAATAAVLNLLSVGAAYGLLVLVFQYGIGAGLLGFHHYPTIEAWVPLFLFSVLFGLSMDYQVFLLSRIKERYDQTGDTTKAVTFGVASTARIITGAALIIVAVFAGFASGQLIMFQQMGFGIGAALLIDATVIRSVLLPSAMHLLGRWNWYLPRWLDWLPRLQVEGGKPTQAPASAPVLATSKEAT